MNNLTKNEKKVLLYLLEDGRLTDAKIARNLRMTVQGARKIRLGLEEKGVIEGYSVKINYSSMGISVYAITLVKVLPAAWDRYTAKEIEEKLSVSNLVKLYRIMSGSITHVLVYGFRDMPEMNRFFRHIQEHYNNYLSIERINTFSEDGLGRKTIKGLIRKILNDEYWSLKMSNDF
jgi:Lrp/AsnC family transcriptional regulator, leucine-responsive regulatory protein